MILSDDIISTIHEKKDSLSKSEKHLSEAILADVNFAIQATTKEMAIKSGVSSPTITRFCRSLGLKGLKELKVKLAQSLSVGNRYVKLNVGSDNIQDVSSNVISEAQLALHHLHQALDYQALEQAVSSLCAAQKIVIFGGGGGASVVAQDTEYRLFRLSLHVISYTDSQLQRMVAATLKEEDNLIIISTSGRDQELVECSQIASNYHCKVIAITRPRSPLAETADIVIPVDIPETKDILKPTASRYALLATIDILANQIGIQMGEKATENLRRIKYQLMANRDIENTEPLGD